MPDKTRRNTHPHRPQYLSRAVHPYTHVKRRNIPKSLLHLVKILWFGSISAPTITSMKGMDDEPSVDALVSVAPGRALKLRSTMRFESADSIEALIVSSSALETTSS